MEKEGVWEKPADSRLNYCAVTHRKELFGVQLSPLFRFFYLFSTVPVARFNLSGLRSLTIFWP